MSRPTQGGLWDGTPAPAAYRGTFELPAGASGQVALQAMIQAAVEGIDRIDGRFLQTVVAAHPPLGRSER